MIHLGNNVFLVTRAEWGARRPRSRTGLAPTYGTTAHWEGPHMGSFPHSSCAVKVRGIQAFHMDVRKWQDIAYTALVCPHGYVFQGRWVGNRTAANGTNNGNNTAYAVCYLGGIGDPYTSAGSRAMLVALNYLDKHGGAGPGRNGHRDWKNTQCPGDTIYRWVHTAGQGGVIVAPKPPPKPDPEPPKQGARKKMLYLIKRDDKPHVWITDFVTKRHVKDSRHELPALIWVAASAGQPISTGPNNQPHVFKGDQRILVDNIPTVE